MRVCGSSHSLQKNCLFFVALPPLYYVLCDVSVCVVIVSCLCQSCFFRLPSGVCDCDCFCVCECVLVPSAPNKQQDCVRVI
jgi:hypothetical protein